MIAKPVREYVNYLLAEGYKPSKISYMTGLPLTSIYSIKRQPELTVKEFKDAPERIELKRYVLEHLREGETLQQVGDAVGLTRERIRQLRNKWIIDVKQEYEALDEPETWEAIRTLVYSLGIPIKTIAERAGRRGPSVIHAILKGDPRYVSMKNTQLGYKRRHIRLSVIVARVIVEETLRRLGLVEDAVTKLEALSK